MRRRMWCSLGRETDEDELRKVERLFGQGEQGSPVDAIKSAASPAANDVDMVLLDSEEEEPGTEPGTEDEAPPPVKEQAVPAVALMDLDDEDDDEPRPLSMVSSVVNQCRMSRPSARPAC